MVAPSRALLAGIAEVDETEIPLRGKDDPITGGGGRSSQSEMLVAGAIEVADGAPGRIRLATIEDFSATSLHGFVACERHCHVNRKFADQMTMAVTVHAAMVAWRHVSKA